MAATVTLRVFTGTNAGTMSGAVSGIDLINADNTTNSLANRNAFPIPAGGRSYEKWIKARVDAAPANQITNFRAWSSGSTIPDATLYIGATASGATPTNATSTVATNDIADYTSGSRFNWDTASTLVNIGDLSRYLVLQLAIDAAHGPGNVPTQTVSFAFDEQ